MTRVTWTTEDGTTTWIDPDAATCIPEDWEVTGPENPRRVGCASRIEVQLGCEELYLTRSGRWVLHRDARAYYDGGDTWRDITPEEARLWLLRAGSPEAEQVLAERFPETEEEEGPAPGGRPPVGPALTVRFPAALTVQIDAVRGDTTRAAWLREAAEQRLNRLTLTSLTRGEEDLVSSAVGQPGVDLSLVRRVLGIPGVQEWAAAQGYPHNPDVLVRVAPETEVHRSLLWDQLTVSASPEAAAEVRAAIAARHDRTA